MFHGALSLGNAKSVLYKVLLLATIVYHFILAWFYGGFPRGGYPDEYWIISTGVYLVENISRNAFQYPIVDDKMIMLPLYIGVLYKLFGFPSFLYVLCSWGLFSMIILMLGAYLVGKHYLGDEEIGYLAALLVGWNWHIGWYAHRLINDVMLAAFTILTFGLASILFVSYTSDEKRKYVLTSLVGMSFALTMWAKESAPYLTLPLLLWIIINIRRLSFQEKFALLFSFLVTSLPFAFICLIRYGHPIYPIVNRIYWYRGHISKSHVFPPFFHSDILLWLPLSLGVGLICFVLMLYGMIHLFVERRYFLFIWAIYCYLFYIFFIPTHFDQYMVQFTPFFLTATAYGLKRITKIFQNKKGFSTLLYAALILLAIFSTNLYGSPLIYSFKRGEFVIPTPLHQRIAFEKFDKIWNLCRCAKDLKGYEWLSCLYEN